MELRRKKLMPTPLQMKKARGRVAWWCGGALQERNDRFADNTTGTGME
jgi:hypothetical protein